MLGFDRKDRGCSYSLPFTYLLFVSSFSCSANSGPASVCAAVSLLLVSFSLFRTTKFFALLTLIVLFDDADWVIEIEAHDGNPDSMESLLNYLLS